MSQVEFGVQQSGRIPEYIEMCNIVQLDIVWEFHIIIFPPPSSAMEELGVQHIESIVVAFPPSPMDEDKTAAMKDVWKVNSFTTHCQLHMYLVYMHVIFMCMLCDFSVLVM